MTIEGMLRSRATPWVLVALAVGGAVASLLIFYMSKPDDHAGRRWKQVVSDQPTPRFAQLLTSAANNALPAQEPVVDRAKPHVSAYSVATIPHPPPTLRDLADHGQASAIDFLAHGSTAAPHSWIDLQKALVDTNEMPPGEKDPFQFDRTLVATVTKGTDWDPGDRMVWTRVFIKPINFLFAGYTVAATENEAVKIKSVEATSTRKFSADLGLTIPGTEGPKASVGPSAEQTTKTTSDINAQYEKLGIDIKPDFLRIIRESETGGDAVGNTTVSLSVVTDQYRIQRRDLNPEVKTTLKGEEVEVLVTDVSLDDKHPDQSSITALPQAPIPHCPLMARVWMLYEERRVEYGRQYYDEGMQTVSLIRDAEAPRDMEIVGADDVSPAVWTIKVLPGKTPDPSLPESGPDPGFVTAHIGKGPSRRLVFTDYAKASRLSHWFRINAEARLTSNAEAKLGELDFDYPPGASFVPSKNTRPDECRAPGEQQESRNLR